VKTRTLCLPTCRDDDFELLEATLADDVELRDDHRVAFSDMRDRLRAYQRELTPGQRRYLVGVAGELHVSLESPEERNRDVPRGREVQVPAALGADSLRRALEARKRRI
jgi:hypothetical protein